jgi:hypothetical protein
MKPARSDGSDLRWKRPEKKAYESAGVRRFLAGRNTSRRKDCVKGKRIQGSDSAYFGRFNDKTVVTCDSYI